MIKKKEWSLENKKYWLTDTTNYIPDCDHEICNQEQINKYGRDKQEQAGTYYSKKDIEILKEKLIEDLKLIIQECKTVEGFRCDFAPKLLKSIDRRFGRDIDDQKM